MKLKQLNKKIIDRVLNGSLEPVEKKWAEYNKFLTLRLSTDTDFMSKLYGCDKAQLRQRQLFILRVLSKYLTIDAEDDIKICFTYLRYDKNKKDFSSVKVNYLKQYNVLTPR